MISLLVVCGIHPQLGRVAAIDVGESGEGPVFFERLIAHGATIEVRGDQLTLRPTGLTAGARVPVKMPWPPEVWVIQHNGRAMEVRSGGRPGAVVEGKLVVARTPGASPAQG